MGKLFSLKACFYYRKQLTVKVTTGVYVGAGTDAYVYLSIENEDGRRSEEFSLDKWWRDDFERRRTDTFRVSVDDSFESINTIQIRKDSRKSNDTWYLEKIVIEDEGKEIIFPVHRWIEDDTKYRLKKYDCFLPQSDPHKEQRLKELQKKKEIYQYEVYVEGGPVQIKTIPDNEKFTYEDKFEITAQSIKSKMGTVVIDATTGRWDSLEDYENIFKHPLNILDTPHSLEKWMEDYWFGLQRTQGVNPNLLKLCDKIPENFGIESSMVEAFLNGSSLEESMEKKRIFIIDLKILENIYTAENHVVCKPMALFYLDDNDNILPIAIQLFQEKGSDNPVFTPADPPYTWLLVKMYFNHAEVMYHESCTHLGFTHFLAEGIAICTHRNLSPSHPIFKLLAPHFFNVIAINKLAIETIISPGGWIDRTMSVKREGVIQLVEKSLKEWKMDANGNIPKEFSNRGVLDSNILPNYPFRDDTVALYNAIRKYVNDVISHYYSKL
ncbi:polyunsaturated fatty acid 5-lipoxygenase-like [Centruroides vittatus]|uniref:polyunsaturated fatty acid 5-lipoxygenase-like n=1 Tax=Centruroides vittatus TaxID=120091 RepID=UPI00350EB78B